MRLVEIARYPVKPLQGEAALSAEIEADGVRGDHCWGTRDKPMDFRPGRMGGLSVTSGAGGRPRSG